MDIKSLVLAILVLLNTALGLIIYSKNRRSPYHLAFGSFAVNLAFWALTMIMWRVTEDNDVLAIFWMNTAYAAALLIGASLWYFSYAFPEDKRLSLWAQLLFVITTGVHFFAYFFVPQFMVRALVHHPIDGRIVIQNPIGYWIFTIHFGLFYFGGIVHLLKKFLRAKDLLRIQLLYIISGVTLTGILGVYFNLILPSPYVQRWTLIWLGPIFTSFNILTISYAIMRHHVLDVKVIATEFLITFLGVLLAINMFFATSVIDWSFRVSALIVVILIGCLLVRSVRKEVQQREQLEILSKELGIANKELERLDQAKSEFLSIASHQLRTPLTAIKGYSSMLLDGTFGPIGGKIKEGVEKVYASTERMVALVNDLLDTSRLDSGRMVFNFVETDLGEMAKSVCDELMPKGKEKGLAIACTVAPVVPKVFVDQMKIRQVLVNFVDNALKYSDTGTVEVKLECKPSTTSPSTGSGDNGELVFSVHDNGWGMTTEEMGFLFKKFSRGRGDTSHIKGTGLGLYVARRLAEAHGGRVWAESPGKGQGSTFFLALKVGWKPPTGDGVYQPKDE